MKAAASIERGTLYLYVRLGEVVMAIGQVATVKGHAMWEVERTVGNGARRHLIVPESALTALPPSAKLLLR